MATNPEMPQVGQDYPKNWVQFLDWFHSEEACRAYLDQLRWPDGFVCPKCEQPGNPCRSTRGRIICPKCKFQTTVTAGTIFDKTYIPQVGRAIWRELLTHCWRAKRIGRNAKQVDDLVLKVG